MVENALLYVFFMYFFSSYFGEEYDVQWNVFFYTRSMLPHFFYPHGNLNKICTFARYFIQVVGANDIGRGTPMSRIEINCGKLL